MEIRSEVCELERRAIKNFGTVANAFKLLDETVVKSHEATDMFKLVLTRLETARAKFQTAAQPQAEDARGRFEEALEKFVMLVSPYPNKVLADRVIQYIKLQNQLWKIHEILDGFFCVANIAEGNDRWRKDMRDAETAQVEALQNKLDDHASLSDELTRDVFVYYESLTILRHAKESRDLDKWNSLAKTMYELALLFDVNPALSRERSSDVPPWFVPASDVEFNTTAFARGSFGSVHHGVWAPGTNVVVKVVLDDGRMERDLMEKFIDEADLWAKFTFPYVSRMFGACHVSLPPFFICEDAANGNMADYLARVEAPEKKVWRILYQAALGIHYLHKKKVVHGDLKLNNILVGKEGYARVTDFGLSRIHKDSEAKSMSKLPDGRLVDGALRWRAPECFIEEKPGFEADVYAFGLCIYEAFKGEIPYANLESNEAVKQSICDGVLPDKPDNMAKDDWDIVLQMLIKVTDERAKLEDKVIPFLKKHAEDEEAEERKNIRLCENCDNKLPSNSNFCYRCGIDVRHKLAEDEVVRISSPDDIARAIHLINIGLNKQKISAARGLINYVFGEPAHQILVHEAGAVPMLVKTLEEIKDEDVRLECVQALGSIYAVNEPVQNTADYEGTIGILKDAFEQGPVHERAKAAMAMGLLADSNDVIVKKLGQEMIERILDLRESPNATLKLAGENAAEFLEAFDVEDLQALDEPHP